MKRLLLLFSSFFLWLGSFAQPYGNEWVNYGQRYLYFPVSQEGIYRIDSATLASAIGPTLFASIDPRNLQVFARNEEQFVYIAGESDGVFNSSDYMEFYASGNDGRFDSALYDNPVHQANPYFSLFNDTIYYYITWNNSTSNKRYVVETDMNFAGIPPAYFWKQVSFARPNDDAPGYNPTYYGGERLSAGISDARYGLASGWMDQAFPYGTARTMNFPVQGAYTSGPSAISKVSFCGQTNAQQNPDHHLQVVYGNALTVVYDTIFDGFQQHHVTFNLPASNLLATTQISVRSAPLPTPPASELFSVGYGLLKYPHIQDLENKSEIKIIVPDDPNAQKFLLASTGFSGSSPIIYDIVNGRKIPSAINGSQLNALIPNSGSEKEVYIADASQVKSVSYLKPVTPTGQFTNFNLYKGNYAIITHTSLMNEALTYANHRNWKFDPVLADVEELYHQFGWGIRKHPSAIRNFIEFGIDTWTDTLQHLFLLGKSVHAYEGRKNALLGNNTLFEANLVPSLGAKSTDVLLTSGINGGGWEPAVSTGRLAARNGQEVADYLDKVKQYEANLTPELWMKNVVHFHGGSNISEQTLLSYYLNSYKAMITDTLVGARVFDFYKSSTTPIQGLSMIDSIRRIINSGTNLLTFFGHAAGSSFDINIDKASTYNNNGKYPLIIANSCLVGDIHQYNTNPPTTSEDFVLTPSKGAIGFIASVGLGTPTDLNDFSSEMYRQFSYFNYAGPVGISFKNTLQKLGNFYPSDFFLRINVQQMNLHGDPAIQLYGFESPDLDVTAGPVWFEPSVITTDLDSFTLQTVITNKARAFNDDYGVKVIRTFFNGTSDTLLQTVNGTHFADTLSFTFAVDAFNGGGLNSFSIQADETNLITELSELNNDTLVQILIRSDDIVPVWPFRFAVIPDDNFVLKASTGDPFAPQRTYRVQIDTSGKFNSPVLYTTTTSSSGGVVNFQPTGLASMPDSTVYFWRVAKDTVTGHKWRESSFQVINGQEGWGQAHFDQYESDNMDYLLYDTINRLFSLDTTARHLRATNIGNPSTLTLSYAIEYKLDAQVQEYAGCGWLSALHVVVLDSLTLQPWGNKWTQGGVTHNPTHNFGNVNNEGSCRSRVEKYFIFRTSSQAQMDSMASMLSNHIPAGNYVMIYSYLNNMRSQWTPALVNAFGALGASPSITSMNDSLPFIFFVKKGTPSTVVEKIGTSQTDVVELDQALYTNLDYGMVGSPRIGPANSWNTLYMQHKHLETPTSDSSAIMVYGIKADGTESLRGIFYTDNVAVINLGNYVNAGTYPYIRLETFKGDKVLRTPPQLYRWQVLYDPVPELSLNASKHYSFQGPVVQEGESVKASIAISNISARDMDSTYISWYTEDHLRRREVIRYEKIGGIPVDSSRIVSIDFSSRGMVGDYQLFVESNPLDQNWELEQYHFNNLGAMNFSSEGDRTNPLLDVTFDGMHILNRDIVSPSAMVVIGLKDENKFLLLNDTTKFGVYLLRPGETAPERLNFTTDMQFIPASLPNNSCRIIFQGDFHKDGIYKLLVQASDISDNKSGGNSADLYEIEFEVINKSSITEILNYPNPFSTSTRFVFVLTGSKIPEHFRIQILTVTGKVVKEIDQFELGPIRIGRNITEYAWDGRDMFGDQLANGVYLYRVVAEIDGQPIDHRNSGADSYFHRGFGKMYLLKGN